jgi:hypothetical protein
MWIQFYSKSKHNDITEILLKVALNIITLTPKSKTMSYC